MSVITRNYEGFHEITDYTQYRCNIYITLNSFYTDMTSYNVQTSLQ